VTSVSVFPPPPDKIRDGLFSVIAGALAGGAPEPSWVAVDDGSGSWVVEVSTRPAVERAHGVVAASNEDALVKAQLLGVGGAMWLPPSSLAALDAFSTASSTEAPVAFDGTALELLDRRSAIQIVSVVDRPFWRSQLGDRVLEDFLTELAVTLGAPAAILKWPALVVAERDPGKIIAAWDELGEKRGTIGVCISVLSMKRETFESGLLEGAYAALAEGASTTVSPCEIPPQPVHELPHGRRVGSWLMRSDKEFDEEGWFATPIESGAARCPWGLEGPEASGTVVEVLGSEEVSSLEDVVAIRIPGWASRGLRPGSPSALLVAKIADAAMRRELPLWIPGIDREGLRFVLSLPGVMWVDGPAVPR
jgi:hypothetical protein